MEGRSSQVRDVVARLEAAVIEYKRRNGRDHYQIRANPPATNAQIETLERHLGRKLPPSYRAFLEMHDGYVGLACPGNMLSIAEMLPGSAIRARIEEYRGDMVRGDLIVLADAIFFASHEEPNDWGCFYPERVSAAGEWAVGQWLTADDFDYDDFVAYLESCIDFCEYVPDA